MVYHFHTHSTLSDGKLSPMELIRRAVVAGYRGMAITSPRALIEKIEAERAIRPL